VLRNFAGYLKAYGGQVAHQTTRAVPVDQALVQQVGSTGEEAGVCQLSFSSPAESP
jgi:hypothetical protein